MKTFARTVRSWAFVRCCLLASLAASSTAAFAQAQIQITPLPEQKPAAVVQLGAHELTASDAQPWLDERMAKAMQQQPIAGAVVVVVKDGNLLLAKGYGYADVAAKKPVDPASTLFRVGSLSNLFTWTAVMQLVEQHQLDLDADINRYLDFSMPPRDGKPITLRDLMTHTAGFEEASKDLFVPDAAALISNEAWVKRWVPARIYPAGDVPAYSNYGAALAGYIVQRVSKQPFEAYVEQHIFQPLDMQHASFRQPLPPALQPDMALSYSSPTEPPHAFELIPAAPAGALSISGDDMARFMIAHLQFGRAGEAQLLAQPTVQAMHGYTRTSVPGLHGMSLGFVRMDRNEQEILGHSGATRYFHSELALFTAQHVGVFVAIDGDADRTWLRQLRNDFADRYFPALPQIRQPTLATAQAHGAQLVGSYLPSRISRSNLRALRNLFEQTQVTMAPDGTLRTPMFDNVVGPVHWREIKPFLWLDDASGSHLGAVMQDGKVRMLAIDDTAPTLVFLPVPDWLLARWNMPLLAVTLTVFLLVALSWPLAALLRRLRGKPWTLEDGSARWYRLSRVTAILQLLFAAGWWLMLPRLDSGTAQLDLRLRLLQLVGWLAVLGTVAVAINAWHAWRAPGGWWRKLDSVILLLACFVTIWFVGSQHLLSLHLDY
ncbi:serine hydrolase domain-containing protein [Dyella sp. RRB7]|uniref:serine hydrolase domain-containing protein n=1 Tax=Dyella sp. RRB7 TaxID=2919502 RepID=UPI001FAB0876|nr:serine hydrolase domain-containing protein [Dyella sp. RRB7]